MESDFCNNAIVHVLGATWVVAVSIALLESLPCCTVSG